MLSFADALKVNRLRMFSSQGRASRSEFGWLFVAVLGISLIPYIIVAVLSALHLHLPHFVMSGFMLICLIINLVMVIILIFGAIRRLHDCNYSGKWLIFLIFPGMLLRHFSGLLFLGALIFLLFKSATPGSNRFGANPETSGFYDQLLGRTSGASQQWQQDTQTNWQQSNSGFGADQAPGANSAAEEVNPLEKNKNDDFADKLKARRW